MTNVGDEWYRSFVMNSAGDTRFFIIINKGITAILNNRNVEVGKFYEVKYAFNDKFEERHRARHYVIRFRPIEPLADIRVEDFGSNQGVWLTTTASFDGFVQTPNGERMKLYNDTFGNFFDLDKIIKNNGMMVEFEFKCVSSPVEKTKSVFVPKKVIRYFEPTPKSAPIVGFVGTRETEDALFVWSKGFNDPIRLDRRFCPPYQDVRSRWIEMIVEDYCRVVEPVEIIGDLYETRVENRVPEIFVSLKHDGIYEKNDRKFHIYIHQYFGFVTDPDYMISQVVKEGEYQVWINEFKMEGVNSCWKISDQQEHPRLLNDANQSNAPRQENTDVDQFDRRPVSPQNVDRNQQLQEHLGPSVYPRRFSPQRSLDSSRRNSRSPPRRQLLNGESVFGNDRQRLGEDPNLPKSSAIYRNQGEPGRSDNGPTPSGSRDRISRAGANSPDSDLDAYNQVSEDDEDVAPATRREVLDSPEVMRNLNHTGFVSDCEEKEEDQDRRKNVMEWVQNSDLPHGEARTPAQSFRASEGSKYGTPLATFTPARESNHFVRESSEVSELRNNLQHAIEIMEFWSRDAVICQAMQLMDNAKFEEMMEIIEKKNKQD